MRVSCSLAGVYPMMSVQGPDSLEELSYRPPPPSTTTIRARRRRLPSLSFARPSRLYFARTSSFRRRHVVCRPTRTWRCHTSNLDTHRDTSRHFLVRYLHFHCIDNVMILSPHPHCTLEPPTNFASTELAIFYS